MDETSQQNPQNSGLLGQLHLMTVERALMDLRRGMPVIVTASDGSGSLIAAAELIDLDCLDFMENETCSAAHIHLTHRRAETLKIRLYTEGGVTLPLDRTDPLGPLARIVHLADPARDLEYPMQGPFIASREPLSAPEIASLTLAKLAGLLPASVSAPMNKDETNALTMKHPLLSVAAEDISTYEARAAAQVSPVGEVRRPLTRVTDAKVPLGAAPDTRIFAFRPNGAAGGGPEHLAIVIGSVEASRPALVRLHSECFTGDLLGSLKCDCGEQLRGAIAAINEEGSGILLYLAQEGRGIGLMNKLRAYQLQDQGFDTVEANLRLGFEIDERLFESAAEMLRQLGVHGVRLMTNNPDKVKQLKSAGISVSERVPHTFPTNEHNVHYLATKASKTGHLL